MRRARLTASILIVLVVLAMAPFTAGYLIGRADGIGPSRTPVESWLARAGISSPRTDRAPVPAPSPELDDVFHPFWETWGYIGRDFYDGESIEPHRLSRGAIRGMLASLQDPHTLYLDPTHRQITDADLRGAFEGIGVQVEMEDERLRIVSPLEGSPGLRAGLRSGDVITQVDGTEVRGVSLLEAIQMIRGPRGSSVKLMIVRNGGEPFEVSVPREEIRVPAVRGEVRPDGIAYIRISTFSLRVGADLREVLDQLNQREPRGWVLDLRGNPGGYLDGAVAVTSQFVSDRIVLYEDRRSNDREEIRTRGRARAPSGPMAVMVDRGTASAAEIVAAALRDHGRATIIGEQTYGKGTVQIVHSLSDGGALRLTVARWLTPNGDPIQGIGLAPEIKLLAEAGAGTALDQAAEFVLQQPASASSPTSRRQASRPAPFEEAPRVSQPRTPPWTEASILDASEQQTLGSPELV